MIDPSKINNPSETKTNTPKLEEVDLNLARADKLKAGLFFTLVTAFGFLSGFGFSLSSTKKKETKDLKPQTQREFYHLYSSGTELARRALFRATIYSVSGVSLICLGVWKLSGAKNFEEFRFKVGSILPNLSKPKDQQQGRTEFKNLTELFQYIIDEDNKSKKEKQNPIGNNNSNSSDSK